MEKDKMQLIKDLKTVQALMDRVTMEIGQLYAYVTEETELVKANREEKIALYRRLEGQKKDIERQISNIPDKK